MANQRECPCGRLITGKRELCRECVDVYGDERDEWPEWLRFLVNDLQRELKSELRGYMVDHPPYFDIDEEEDYTPEVAVRASLIEQFDEDGLLILRFA